MMKFENTERLTSIERIKLVSREIVSEYPELNVDDAIKMASFCDIVTDDVSIDTIFRRYYYMLFVLEKGSFIFNKIYDDMRKSCKDSLDDELNKVLFADMERFYNNEIDEFPVISNYYGEE